MTKTVSNLVSITNWAYKMPKGGSYGFFLVVFSYIFYLIGGFPENRTKL